LAHWIPSQENDVPGLLPHVDPDGLLEYSVVFTDRSLNHMSRAFQEVMRDISGSLRQVYGARSVALVPGGGTAAMEAVARQYATDRRCLVIRNGWFSYRWSQIFEAGGIPAAAHVLAARPQDPEAHGVLAAWAPPPLDEVVAWIESERPDLVLAAHVETSAGILLPDAYIRAVADAVRAGGGMMVLDCIASGALWVDMEAAGVDILISAPQKGWSATPSCGLVMLGEEARRRIESTSSSSFTLDLKKWLQIMEVYEGGGHAYHATLPTDGLRSFRDAIRETEAAGLGALREAQVELGGRVRDLLAHRGFPSVAAPGFEAPSVVVSHTDDDRMRSGALLAAAGLQVAAGVPLQCGEPEGFRTFRIGLLGLDKLLHVGRTVRLLEEALDQAMVEVR
jgi:aspartate aminotransferase-like enzyme